MAWTLRTLGQVASSTLAPDSSSFILLSGGIPKYNAKKAKADKELSYIMRWFHVSMDTAKAHRRLISADELKKIKFFYEKMGRKK